MFGEEAEKPILYFIIIYYNLYYMKIYGQHLKWSMDQPGKVVNPACGWLKTENDLFPVPVRA